MFRDWLAEPLVLAMNAAKEIGVLPGQISDGEIAMIYKKKNPADVRNYRPITLLNGDYTR